MRTRPWTVGAALACAALPGCEKSETYWPALKRTIDSELETKGRLKPGRT